MKILLATDGSGFAKEAAAQCGELISGLDSPEVKVITVADYTPDAESEPFMSSEEFLREVEKEMTKRSDSILQEAEDIIKYKNRDVAIGKEMFVGSAKRVIIAEANKWQADLIVLGSHGYGFFSRALLGSVSDSVLHHADCSVLIAKSQRSPSELRKGDE